MWKIYIISDNSSHSAYHFPEHCIFLFPDFRKTHSIRCEIQRTTIQKIVSIYRTLSDIIHHNFVLPNISQYFSSNPHSSISNTNIFIPSSRQNSCFHYWPHVFQLIITRPLISCPLTRIFLSCINRDDAIVVSKSSVHESLSHDWILSVFSQNYFRYTWKSEGILLNNDDNEHTLCIESEEMFNQTAEQVYSCMVTVDSLRHRVNVGWSKRKWADEWDQLSID